MASCNDFTHFSSTALIFKICGEFFSERGCPSYYMLFAELLFSLSKRSVEIEVWEHYIKKADSDEGTSENVLQSRPLSRGVFGCLLDTLLLILDSLISIFLCIIQWWKRIGHPNSPQMCIFGHHILKSWLKPCCRCVSKCPTNDLSMPQKYVVYGVHL